MGWEFGFSEMNSDGEEARLREVNCANHHSHQQERAQKG